MATKQRRIAVVGGGVAGLSAAWHFHSNTPHHVELFEAEERLGGHAYSVDVNGTDVDIGFMVYNDANYPNMKQWFHTLGVQDEESDMSLSVSLDGGTTVEWSSDGLNGAFANRWQAIQPSFYTYIKDMVRFNSQAVDLLKLAKDDPRRAVATGQYLRDHGYSDAFCTYYLLPMMAAIWSASIDDVLQFPAEQMVEFFCNHKLLQLFSRPQVRTLHVFSRAHLSRNQTASNINIANSGRLWRTDPDRTRKRWETFLALTHTY
jgi:cyclopropane-fatty-acyl-phospholipid synthase